MKLVGQILQLVYSGEASLLKYYFVNGLSFKFLLIQYYLKKANGKTFPTFRLKNDYSHLCLVLFSFARFGTIFKWAFP
jgi:hypothetical protein